MTKLSKSTIEHAPGPYFYQRERYGCDDSWDIMAADGSYVASILHWVEPDTFEAEETEANARLLAAAPDLLSALERLVSRAQDFRMAVGPDQDGFARESRDLRRACNLAHAAIAKATGGRP